VANELTLSVAANFLKSGAAIDTSDMDLIGQTFTVNGTDWVKATQSIGTTAEILGKGEITTPGYLIIKNTDATNYIELDKATFTTASGTVKLKAGEFALLRVSSTNIYACANTAACVVRYLFLED
jgi:hypothetical protein